MQMLGELALKGQTVVAVIHQPSYEILEHVHHIVIVRKGHLGFNGFGLAPLPQGGLEAAAELFRQTLPADWTNERPPGAAGRFDFIPPGKIEQKSCFASLLN
jgi:hypothetical protein